MHFTTPSRPVVFIVVQLEIEGAPVAVGELGAGWAETKRGIDPTAMKAMINKVKTILCNEDTFFIV